MAKNKQNTEEAKAAKAEAVAEAVNKQAEEDARKAEEKAIYTGKDMELLEGQVYEEEQDENPFIRPVQAEVKDIREGKNGQKWVQFQPYLKDRRDGREPAEVVLEGEFRARFPIPVK